MANQNDQIVIDLLEPVADNKFVLGDHLVEIGFSGPNLEATLASVAIAQAELGHARLLYNWINELKTGERKKQEVKEQSGKAFASTENVEDWISLMASLYTTNITSEIILDIIVNSPYSDKMVAKMLREQKENIVYAETWCDQLVNDKGQIPVKFEKALAEASKDAIELLQSWQNDDRLVHLGFKDNEIDLTEKFNEQIDKISSNKVAIETK